jgi:hypothetical protein
MADVTYIHKSFRGSGSGSSIAPIPPPIIPTVIDGLQGVAIKSHVAGTSFHVIKGIATIAYGINQNVAGWTVVGNVVHIVGANPVTLNFLNPSEAQIGEARLKEVINGHTVI